MSVIPCPSPAPQPVFGVVVFEPAAFKTKFPAFATVADALLQADFDLATLFLNNSCCSIVRDANVRETLLNLLVAHIATLLQGANGQAPSGLVGWVSGATEGSVSVQASYITQMSMSEAYFSQTPYGLIFWQATARFRSFTYIPPPNCGPAGYGGLRGRWPLG
jgi:hypothetical protein